MPLMAVDIMQILELLSEIWFSLSYCKASWSLYPRKESGK